MSRLPDEFRRLFLADATAPVPAGAQASAHRRALVLEVARPASWQPLSAVWHGVQTELGLPAPAIAVNGRDGMQLWFSVAQPLDDERASAFLEGLRQRFLAALPRARLGLMPAAGADSDLDEAHWAGSVPALQAATGGWSAFVAPDLAPIFEDTPWLDMPPGDSGQAVLLERLRSITPAEFDAAMEQLWPRAPSAAPAGLPADGARAADSHPVAAPATGHADAKTFLLAVMNDPNAPLALRIDAAKALLPYTAAP